MNLQKTLVVLKPDAVVRGLLGEIVTRFEKVGLKLVGAKMMNPDEKFYYHHYETIGKMISRRGQQAFDVTLTMMQYAPVLAMVWEWVEAVSLVRKMVGATEPKSANPGTIRGDYSHVSFAYADATGRPINNLIHASWDPEEAALEVAHWFSQDELYAYDTVHSPFVN